jgi:hypothetical protein
MCTLRVTVRIYLCFCVDMDLDIKWLKSYNKLIDLRYDILLLQGSTHRGASRDEEWEMKEVFVEFYNDIKKYNNGKRKKWVAHRGSGT